MKFCTFILMGLPLSHAFLAFLTLTVITTTLADPRATQIALICDNQTADATNRQTFINNFLAAMDAVTPQIAARRYARTVQGTSINNTVYAFGDCMKDLSQADCDLCFATSKTQILRCLPFQLATRGGRNFLDGCYLRYDDYDFFGEALTPVRRTVCGNVDFSGNQSIFNENAKALVKNLSVVAPNNDGFSVGSIEKGNITVYGLAQCWKLVNQTACRSCLDEAAGVISSCVPKSEGRVLNSGCYMRYSYYWFYNSSGSDTGGDNGGPNLAVILAVVLSAVAFGMITVSAVIFMKRKVAKRRKERRQLGALATTVHKSNVNFKFETLEKATDFFNDSNKLGQGGSGSVFKGVLPDGKVVAIKRLFFNTAQWVEEFFNEVNLISKVDHKNLVKLLGCSITGPESLLVYEYAPNQSLHDHLSDRERAHLLTWEMRFNIIMGTAEGLTYLHEESSLRIIHRDIKLSNILLDEYYTARIADFGLVRLFPEDKTHISTGVAGTLGYMAPEYLVRGKLTEKADVYSFGVVVIEIVCGKRSDSQIHDPLTLLQNVWSLYTESRLSEAVDPRLEGRFPAEEATRMLKIGLLCAQASAEMRPSMSVVVRMLKDDSSVPSPTQPPFLHSSTGILVSPNISNSQAGSSMHSSADDKTSSLVVTR